MNERIRELAEQQGITGPNYLISSQELAKFAELIVRECAVFVGDKESIAVKQMFEHFGVEE